ncbi:MAG TPA: uL30 family ribosomal protein [Candidatus Paceibacterota bacterium]|nr:uL30 family ribosomal protein [Candidatus Paceibacterota bacterium]
MIAIIRITGQVKVDEDIENTLYRLKLRKKYTCTILHEDPVTLGMIKKVRNFVAYGKIDEKTIEELIEKRGQPIDKSKKIDVKKIVELLKKEKSFENTGIKPFFRLHPPRGGINAKLHYPKGVLGDNKESMSLLLKKML